jgi:RimJ/RimL family protein N-acetyltransferase
MIGDRASGRTAGWVGPTHPDYVPGLAAETEIAWSLRQPFWGRGIATEGAKAAVSAALEHVRPTRLISLIDPANVRSIAVAKRVGMRDVGIVVHEELDLELQLYALEVR